jgi:hypothetical protein
MIDPNQYNIPTDSTSRDASLDSARFERFTDRELMIFGDALRELLQVKTEALQIVNADLGSNPESPYTEQDFGIPAIEAMLAEVEAPQ